MVGDRRKAGAKIARQLGERRAVLVRGQRLDDKAPVLALEQVDRARSDRAGGAENCDTARLSMRLARGSSG